MNNEKFEPIRIRIMKEAYNLADRGDAEGYNAIKVMCDEIQKMLQREWVWLTDDEIHEMTMKIRTKNMGVVTTKEIFREAEAKSKEKNT